MKYIALAYLVAAAIGIFVWKSLPKFEHAAVPVDRNAVLFRRGEVIYKTRCTTCHNPDPGMVGSIGPALRGVSTELLTERLTNGKNGMPAQKPMLRFVPALREYLR